MGSKYNGLPDIDTAPDIFETTDEPEGLLIPSEKASDDNPKKAVEGLDTAGLPDRSRANQIFGRSRTKQSYRLPPLRTHTLSSDSETEDDRRLESTAAKLRRLKAELAQVEQEIQAGPSTSGPGTGNGYGKRRSVLPPRPAVDLSKELNGLKERLGVLEDSDLGREGEVKEEEDEWASRLQRLKVSEQSGPDGDTGKEGQGQSTQEVGEGKYPISDLDKRLARLEAAIGSDESQTPLLPSLTKTDHLLSLLTQPRHLDAISRRVKLLLVDLDRAATASRRTASQTPNLSSSPEKQPTTLQLSPMEYNQLQTLFNLLPRIDPLLPILDPLLTRLKSLQGLHAESADVAEGLRKLQSGRKGLDEERGELGTVVEEVQKGIEEAVGGIERNWKSLETRLEALDKRIKDLAEIKTDNRQ